MIDYYSYWNTFVLDWIKSPYGPENLLNTALKDGEDPDYSKYYVPEPWWGNDGTDPLYSVCVNLNPGKGDSKLHTISNAKLKGITEYKDLFLILPDTHNWHQNRRAAPIGNALRAVHNLPAGDIKNHLSIELIPWHTEHATQELRYWDYVLENLESIYRYSILFAYEKSHQIEGPLKSKVILRFSGACADKLFKELKRKRLIGEYRERTLNLESSNTHVQVYTIDSLSDCEFIAIWRSSGYGLNNFPCAEDMKEIITLITSKVNA